MTSCGLHNKDGGSVFSIQNFVKIIRNSPPTMYHDNAGGLLPVHSLARQEVMLEKAGIVFAG